MKKNIFILVIFLFLLHPYNIYATSGALKGGSIKQCPDGNYYGMHSEENPHWHLAEKSNVKSGWSAVGDPLPGDPCPDTSRINQRINPPQEETTQTESNNTVQNQQEPVVTEKTEEQQPIVQKEEQDVEIEKETREEEKKEIKQDKKSDNVDIILKYKGEKIKFNNFVSETIYPEKNVISFEIEKDEKIKTNLQKEYRIKEGNNHIELKVTAESGKEQIYKIEVYKYSDFVNSIINIIAIIITIAIFLVLPIGAIIYLIIKRKKK